MTEPDEPAARREGDWSPPVERLATPDAPSTALNVNVGGRRVAGPVQGFGKLWQKTYRVDLGDAITPRDVMTEWRAHFGELWPAGNRFYAPLAGIAPGEVALLNLAMPGGLELSTGVLVLYADEESFTLMTPEGHQFAGWITFSSFRVEGEAGATTVAQTQVLMRASDPLYELGMAFGGHRVEDTFWVKTLAALAALFGLTEPAVTTTATCVDRRRQWRRAGNVRRNGVIRSTTYRVRRVFPGAARRSRPRL